MAMLPTNNTSTFLDVFPQSTTLAELPSTLDWDVGLTEAQLKKVWQLLAANYGHRALKLSKGDLTQWEMRLCSALEQYGPAYFARLQIQKDIAALSLDDLREAGRSIINHAYNPNSEPSTSSLEELTYINEQNSSGAKLSKADALTLKWKLINTDYTALFLALVGEPLFSRFISDDPAYWYGDVDVED